MKVPCAFVAAGFVLASAAASAQSGNDLDASMRRLAADRGCSVCHAEKPRAPGDGILAYAPSWPEIARRYRGRADAQDYLSRIVAGGTAPDTRHWRNQAAFAAMLPNEPRTTPEEARSLVRWILAWPR